jgi:hypothetical protein
MKKRLRLLISSERRQRKYSYVGLALIAAEAAEKTISQESLPASAGESLMLK